MWFGLVCNVRDSLIENNNFIFTKKIKNPGYEICSKEGVDAMKVISKIKKLKIKRRLFKNLHPSILEEISN